MSPLYLLIPFAAVGALFGWWCLTALRSGKITERAAAINGFATLFGAAATIFAGYLAWSTTMAEFERRERHAVVAGQQYMNRILSEVFQARQDRTIRVNTKIDPIDLQAIGGGDPEVADAFRMFLKMADAFDRINASPDASDQERDTWMKITYEWYDLYHKRAGY